jgi:hypothetical protein
MAAATGREPRYSRVGTARQHRPPCGSSSVQPAPVPRTHHTQVPCTAVQAGGQKSSILADHSQIRYEPQEALQVSQGSHRGSGAILAHASAILEAFPGQGQVAESQFHPICATVPGTTYHAQHQRRLSGKSRNRGRLPLP